MFGKRKQKIAAGDLARLIHEECIECQRISPPRDNMEDQIINAFNEKARLYQLAAVMLALIFKERQNGNFTEVKESLEALVFPAEPDESAIRSLSNLKEAMSILNQLISPAEECRQLSWARSWLEGIGVDESNPAVLAQFAFQWVDFYAFYSTCLKNVVHGLPNQSFKRPRLPRAAYLKR